MEVVFIKIEEVYNIFRDGVIDLKKRFDSMEGRFESLERKIDDNFVTKESLKLQLQPYEEMRNDMRRMAWAIVISILTGIGSIVFTIFTSGLLKGVRL